MQWLLRQLGSVSSSQRRGEHLGHLLGGFGLLLVAVTWPLWDPRSTFPQVPVFRWVLAAPVGIQWPALVAMLAGLAGALLTSGRWQVRSLLIFAASATLLVLFDQARFQPWIYQFALAAIVLSQTEARAAIGLLRLLVISFYFYSALTKFDHSYLHTLGQQFLGVLASIGGSSIESWSPEARLAGAFVFPAGELLVAVGLWFSRTRPWALGAAVLLHLLLLVILGPWGLDHRPGVLIWNLYFVFQDLLLFWPEASPTASASAADQPSATPPKRWVLGLVGAALALPLLAPLGWCDTWPGWGLYASSADRATLLIHRRGLEELPDELRSYVVAAEDSDDPWLTLRMDRWSLAERRAPIYPQARYQLGLAEALIARHQLSHRARVVRWSMADRWTGERSFDVLTGLPQLQGASRDYGLNTTPRGDASR